MRVILDDPGWRSLELYDATFGDGYWGSLEQFTQFDGTVIEAGGLVWAQMYGPQTPAYDSTLEERIAHGRTYGLRKMKLLKHITFEVADGQPLFERSIKFSLFDPDRPNDDAQGSWPNADWCYLEPAIREGMLW